MLVPLRPYPPSPSSLIAVGTSASNFFCFLNIFFVNGFYPPPKWYIKNRTFFCGFPNLVKKSCEFSCSAGPRRQPTGSTNHYTIGCSVEWIRIRSDPYHSGQKDSLSSKQSEKTMGNSHIIDKNYQSIIFLKIKISMGKKSLLFF